jgi:hypothetical protein
MLLGLPRALRIASKRGLKAFQRGRPSMIEKGDLRDEWSDSGGGAVTEQEDEIELRLMEGSSDNGFSISQFEREMNDRRRADLALWCSAFLLPLSPY